LQFTIGDTGSSVYAAFGAPIVHEDDPRRAARAVLELQRAATTLGLLEPVPIGCACGSMRTGAYGEATRRTSSVLGDVVSLNAFVTSRPTPRQADRHNQKVTSADTH
jgi:adenylate cyclase